MAYRIEYDTSVPCRQRCCGKPKVTLLAAGFFLLFLLLVNLFWPAGGDLLREILLPGDPAVTAEAVDSLIENLEDGETVSDSVAAFCREIIDNAETQN